MDVSGGLAGRTRRQELGKQVREREQELALTCQDRRREMLEPRARRIWGRGAVLGGGAVCGWRDLAGGDGPGCSCVLHSGLDWGSGPAFVLGGVRRNAKSGLGADGWRAAAGAGRGEASEAERGSVVRCERTCGGGAGFSRT
jgi:hypothetical protein